MTELSKKPKDLQVQEFRIQNKEIRKANKA